MNFEVRQAALADVDQIAAAHLDSIRSIGALYYSPEVVNDWAAPVSGDKYAKANRPRVKRPALVRARASGHAPSGPTRPARKRRVRLTYQSNCTLTLPSRAGRISVGVNHAPFKMYVWL